MSTDKKNNSIINGIAAILFVAFPVFVSVFFENAYFNITPAKLHVFAFIAIPSIILILTVFSLKAAKHTLTGFDLREWFLFVFAFVSLISTILSADFESSFWGTEGWCVGSFTTISAVLILIYISRNLDYNHNLWLPIIIIADIVFIIGILQFSGIDVFSMHKGISEGTYYYYISTIGNVNRFAGYLSLFFPLLLIFYISSDSEPGRTIHLVSLALCTVCVAICASDSVYLGIGFSMFFAIPFICKTGKCLFRLFITISIYGVSLTMISLLPFYASLCNQANGISARIFDIRIGLTVLALGIIGALLAKLAEKKYSNLVRITLTVIFECLLGFAAIIMIIKTAYEFGDSWGSYRGLIWNSSIKSFKDFSVLRKLFGIGPEMLKGLYPDVEAAFGMKVLTAHSQPLQILLSTGIIGFISYIGIWITIFVDFFRRKIYNNICIAFFMPLCAYFAQSFVNSATVVNIPLLIIIASCYIIYCKNSNLIGGKQ